MAEDFMVFSLLLPFDCPSVPVSPSLADELHLHYAHRVTEQEGVLKFQLGEDNDGCGDGGSLNDKRCMLPGYNRLGALVWRRQCAKVLRPISRLLVECEAWFVDDEEMLQEAYCQLAIRMRYMAWACSVVTGDACPHHSAMKVVVLHASAQKQEKQRCWKHMLCMTAAMQTRMLVFCAGCPTGMVGVTGYVGVPDVRHYDGVPVDSSVAWPYAVEHVEN